MDATTGLQALSSALTVYEKAAKIVREWTGKLPDTPEKKEATKDLNQAEEAMELAKVQLAGSLGYFFCRKHFPPGIKLDIREDIYPKWKCSTCGDITPHKQEEVQPRRESWVRGGGRTDYF
jgi:hypothetical protein